MMSVLVSLLLTVRSAVRSRAALQIELALRHQLRVLERSRPHRNQFLANPIFWSSDRNRGSLRKEPSLGSVAAYVSTSS